jgi:hypothetical protein
MLALSCAGIIGCTTASGSKIGKDGTRDDIKVTAFLSKIQDGAYSSGTNGMTLTVTAATPDQQAIATLAGGVVEISKAAMLLSRQPTNATPTTTNAP